MGSRHTLDHITLPLLGAAALALRTFGDTPR